MSVVAGPAEDVEGLSQSDNTQERTLSLSSTMVEAVDAGEDFEFFSLLTVYQRSEYISNNKST